MAKIRLKSETRNALSRAGLHVQALSQPPWLFPKDGRKLLRCSIPSDPWHATLGDHPNPILASRTEYGHGATPDDAILDAIGSNFRCLEREIENLLVVLAALR